MSLTERQQLAYSERDLMKRHFKVAYDEWHNVHPLNDDRIIFVVSYELMINALDTMANIDDPFVWSAFSISFRKTYNVLCRILERFTNEKVEEFNLEEWEK